MQHNGIPLCCILLNTLRLCHPVTTLLHSSFYLSKAKLVIPKERKPHSPNHALSERRHLLPSMDHNSILFLMKIALKMELAKQYSEIIQDDGLMLHTVGFIGKFCMS